MNQSRRQAVKIIINTREQYLNPIYNHLSHYQKLKGKKLNRIKTQQYHNKENSQVINETEANESSLGLNQQKSHSFFENSSVIVTPAHCLHPCMHPVPVRSNCKTEYQCKSFHQNSNFKANELQKLQEKYISLQEKYAAMLQKRNNQLEKSVSRSRISNDRSLSEKKPSEALLQLKDKLNRLDFTNVKKMANMELKSDNQKEGVVRHNSFRSGFKEIKLRF